MDKWRIFLSSTLDELQEYREAVTELFESDAYQGLRSRVELTDMTGTLAPVRPLGVACADEVSRSDLLLLLLAPEAGPRVSDACLTHTEWEVASALAHDIPIISAELPAGATGPRAPRRGDRAAPPDYARRVEALAHRARPGAPAPAPEAGAGPAPDRAPPGTPEDTALALLTAIETWLAQRVKPRFIPLARDGQQIRNPFAGQREPYRLLVRGVRRRPVTIVCGPPGAGKSTLTAALMADCDIQRWFSPVIRVPLERAALTRDEDLPLAVLMSLCAELGAEPSVDRLAGDAVRAEITRVSALATTGPPLVVIDVTDAWRPAPSAGESGPAGTGAAARPDPEPDPEPDPDRAAALIASGCRLLPRRTRAVIEAGDFAAARALAQALGLPPEAVITVDGLQPADGLALLRAMGALHPADPRTGDPCGECERLGAELACHLARQPQLLAIAARELRPKLRHEDLRDAVARLAATPGREHARHITAGRAVDLLTGDEQDALAAAAVLPGKPYPFPADVVGFLRGGMTARDWFAGTHADERGRHAAAAVTDLWRLADRRLIEPAAGLLGPDSGLGAGQEAGVDSHFFTIHPSLAEAARTSLPPAIRGQLGRLRARAFAYYDEKLLARFDNDYRAGWHTLEHPAARAELLAWLTLTLDGSPAGDPVKLESFARVYLRAHWDWGRFLPSELCDALIRVLERSATWAPAARELALALGAFHRAYPKEGDFREPPADPGRSVWREARRHGWEETATAVERLRALFGLPPDAGPLAPASAGGIPATGRTARAEVARYLHAFRARALQYSTARRPLPATVMTTIDRHYRAAIESARADRDAWREPRYAAELGDAWLDAGDPARARAWTELAMAGRDRDPADVDFSTWAAVERVSGDAEWRDGHPAAAFDHYLRALYYALCLQVHPQPADAYTMSVYAEQLWRTAGRVGDLFTEQGVAPAEALEIITRLARACGCPDIDADCLCASFLDVASPGDQPTRDEVITTLFRQSPSGPDHPDRAPAPGRELAGRDREVWERVRRIARVAPGLVRIP